MSKYFLNFKKVARQGWGGKGDKRRFQLITSQNQGRINAMWYSGLDTGTKILMENTGKI